eukprot:4162739-Prymnesium_polylepis.1
MSALYTMCANYSRNEPSALPSAPISDESRDAPQVRQPPRAQQTEHIGPVRQPVAQRKRPIQRMKGETTRFTTRYSSCRA